MMNDCSVQRADLHIYQGDDFAQNVMVCWEDGQPVDLTGCSAKAQIREAPADEDEIVVADLAPVATAEPGIMALTLPRAVTVTLSGRYRWDFEVMLSDGKVHTLLEGDVIATKEITR